MDLDRIEDDALGVNSPKWPPVIGDFRCQACGKPVRERYSLCDQCQPDREAEKTRLYRAALGGGAPMVGLVEVLALVAECRRLRRVVTTLADVAAEVGGALPDKGNRLSEAAEQARKALEA